MLHLLLLLPLACHPRLPSPEPVSSVTLGWRLAAGTDLQYRYLTTIQLGGDVVSRRESWRYLVREMNDQGTYTLEGHIEALSGGILHDGHPLADSGLKGALAQEWERVSAGATNLGLSMDGRLNDLSSGTWSDGLVHRLLSFQLPASEVQVGDQWNDPSIARPFTDPIPSSVAVKVSGTQRLVSIEVARTRGRSDLIQAPLHVYAIIDTSAVVLPEDARFPALDIEGRTRWDLAAGVLDHRTLEVRERGGELPGEPGHLSLEGTRLHPD